MNDLLYVDPSETDKLEKELRNEYPQAHIEDASDYIHRDRLSFECNDITQHDYFVWLLRIGAHELSFAFQMAMYEDRDAIRAAISALAGRGKDGEE